MGNVLFFEKGKVFQKLLCVCFVLLAVFGIALMLPVVHEALFNLIDKVYYKNIRHEIWGDAFFHVGITFLIFGLCFSVLSVFQKWNLVLDSIFNKSGVVTHLKENRKLYFKYFLAFMGCFIFAYLSVIRANVLYADDLIRLASANVNYSYNRYIASLLSALYCLTPLITDISPLTQIIACIFLSASGVILIMCFVNEKKFSFWNIIAVLPLGISPFFAQCMSYRFDAPNMASSVFFALLPLVFYRDRLAYFAVSFVSLLCMLMTYQASSGIFPVAVSFLVLKAFSDGKSWKEIWDFIWTSVVAFIIPMLFFKFCIMSAFSTSVESSMFAIKDMPSGFIGNLGLFYGAVIRTFTPLWKVLVWCILVLFVVLNTINSKQNKLLSFVFSVVCLLFTLCLAFGIYPLMAKPSIPARALYGFTTLIAMIVLFCAVQKKSLLPKILSLVLVWGFIAFTFTYGNALSENEKYERFRLDKVVYDLDSLNLLEKQGRKAILINEEGSLVAPFVRNMTTYNKALAFLCGSGSWKNNEHLMLYYDIDRGLYFDTGNRPAEFEVLRGKMADMPVVKSTYYHDIYADDEYVFVLLKQHPESDWRKR